ncbi:MAG: hypothetical protein HKN56_03230 [Gammaproteobacteria bacterium]|nr:hypothetical protein [Gammaproteobacteria bacterium]
MTTFNASAPGKLVIVGEYAVLHGGPALAIAVSPRARARMVPADAWSLRISNTAKEHRFDWADDRLSWHDDPGPDGSILAAALAVLSEESADLSPAGPFMIELCSEEFFHPGADSQPEKLGLGSSAAVTVALSGCLQQLLGGGRSLDLAMRVHRAHQRGRGSGIDVVTSYQGGLVGVREDGQVSAVDWPAGLHIAPVWTGHAASTPEKLARLAEFATGQPAEHTRLIGALAATAGSARYACDGGDVPGLLAWLDEFGVRLGELDTATGLGIWSDDHQQLAQLAADCGLVYKPSGAGGGDFGLAFSSDTKAVARFRAMHEAAGYRHIDLELGVPGLQTG